MSRPQDSRSRPRAQRRARAARAHRRPLLRLWSSQAAPRTRFRQRRRADDADEKHHGKAPEVVPADRVDRAHARRAEQSADGRGSLADAVRVEEHEAHNHEQQDIDCLENARFRKRPAVPELFRRQELTAKNSPTAQSSTPRRARDRSAARRPEYCAATLFCSRGCRRAGYRHSRGTMSQGSCASAARTP